MNRPGHVAHHFTIDVEEYFQVSAFEAVVPRERWDTMESRVVSSMSRMADLMAKHDVRASLYVLGCVADRHPEMVKDLAARGHEISSHGWDHRRITTITPEAFRISVRNTKARLEDLAGATVHGFRAPSFSITPGHEWALEILKEEGYTYDSSLYPVKRKGYGYPGGKRDPHWVDTASGALAEIPPATLRPFGMNLPAGGGAYFRLFPYRVVETAFRSAERRNSPATFYIHPWEIDPDQPRMPVSRLTIIRHYGGMKATESRLDRLLAEFQFQPVIDTVLSMSPPPAGKSQSEER